MMISLFALIALFWVSCHCETVPRQQGSHGVRNAIPLRGPEDEPYRGSYSIQDSCQYKICGSAYYSEFAFGKSDPVVGSCSGDCDNLSYKLADSQFKKEFMWDKCADMCAEKYPEKDYRTYDERLSCMSECFRAYDVVAPHHHAARACLHSACEKGVQKTHGQQSTMECFEQCTHHLATRVPRDDWAKWTQLLQEATCDPKRMPGNQMDKLTCTDQNLWAEMTKGSSVSPDVHLLCLNAMCDNSVACAKQCLHHVERALSPEDVPKWQQCTYSAVCAEIQGYKHREDCADRCLSEHKRQLQRQREMQRREEEEARRKEAEALQASGGKQWRCLTSLTVISSIVLVFLSVRV